MSEVIDLAAARRKRAADAELARGRTPLYVDRDSGRISASPPTRRRGDPVADFGDRVARIRASLKRINALMAELKEMSAGEGTK